MKRRTLIVMCALAPLCACARPKRPQEPDTRPYTHRTVRLATAAGALVGEMVVPVGNGPFPAVILLAGSGEQDRDETVAGHRPFLVLSDVLARAGIASLRYDKRGVGESEGDFDAATIGDFASDAQYAFDWLVTQPEVAADRIALLGHSEGGLTAPLAARGRPVAALVLMAGPGVPIDQVIRRQSIELAQLQGTNEADIIRLDDAMSGAFVALRAAADLAGAGEPIRAALAPLPRLTQRALLKFLATPWAYDAVRYDPAAEVAGFEGPILALFGGTDKQVDAVQNATVLRQRLAAVGPASRQARVVVQPGLNHLFQPSATGDPREYCDNPVTLSSDTLNEVVRFLQSTLAGG